MLHTTTRINRQS